jgi:hypothetical protein
VGWDGLMSGRTEVVGGGLRDCPAVNERTLTRPIQSIVSIALLSQRFPAQRHIP